MCGITGYFDINNTHEVKIIEEMANALFSRGPDSIGYWMSEEIGISLGHRRLSIQDLSDNGAQPMYSHSKNNIIIFNGEIYNHLEIRRILKKKKRI